MKLKTEYVPPYYLRRLFTCTNVEAMDVKVNDIYSLNERVIVPSLKKKEKEVKEGEEEIKHIQIILKVTEII